MIVSLAIFYDSTRTVEQQIELAPTIGIFIHIQRVQKPYNNQQQWRFIAFIVSLHAHKFSDKFQRKIALSLIIFSQSTSDEWVKTTYTTLRLTDIDMRMSNENQSKHVV